MILKEGPTININYIEKYSRIFDNYLERAKIKTFDRKGFDVFMRWIDAVIYDNKNYA